VNFPADFVKKQHRADISVPRTRTMAVILKISLSLFLLNETLYGHGAGPGYSKNNQVVSGHFKIILFISKDV